MALQLLSCHNGRLSESAEDADSTEIETCTVPDTLDDVEEEIEEADEADRLDTSFDDFMFAFTHSDHLQNKRIEWPLSYTDADGGIRKISSLNSVF